MKSLEHRLQTGLLISLALLMALGWWGVSSATRNIATDLVLSRLEHDAESLLSALQPQAEGTLQLQAEQTSAIYDKPYSGHYFTIQFDRAGIEIRSRSLWDTRLSLPQLAQGQSAQNEISGPDGQHLLVWSGGYRKANRGVTISVAEDLSTLNVSLEKLRWFFAAATVGVLLLLGFLQRGVISTTFRPLHRISGGIDSLARGDKSQLDENVPTEVQPLVKEVNRLLQLMDQRLQRSRKATGNLAHALKTPLTILRQLSHHPDFEQLPQCRDQLSQQLDRLQELIELELKRARIAGRGSVGQRFIADRDVADLIAVLEKAYAEKPLRFELQIEATDTLLADRDDMLELLGNLLDNACKWAQGKVRCSLVHSANFVLAVEDDGPGCTPEEMVQLKQRGKRSDENVPGHGLGLAIAADIAQTYGAEIRLDRSDSLGGLRVRVIFPLPHCSA